MLKGQEELLKLRQREADLDGEWKRLAGEAEKLEARQHMLEERSSVERTRRWVQEASLPVDRPPAAATRQMGFCAELVQATTDKLMGVCDKGKMDAGDR